MEDLELIEYLNNSSLLSERIFRDPLENPLESLNNIDFIELWVYRLRQKSVLFLIKANSYFACAHNRRPRPHIDDYGIFQINVIFLIFDERGRGRGAAVDGLGCGRRARARARARATIDGRAQGQATGAGAGEVRIGLRCTIWYVICIISYSDFLTSYEYILLQHQTFSYNLSRRCDFLPYYSYMSTAYGYILYGYISVNICQ